MNYNNNNKSVSSSSSSSSSTATIRVSNSIPNNVRKTIQNIKEIAKNHSEDDIYAMLKECSMDPNETVQRLLHLDTFHQVKSKRDKRNEVVKSRPNEDSRWKIGHQGRGTRFGRGNASSHYAGVRRGDFTRKENGVDENREKGFRNPPAPAVKKVDAAQPQHVEKTLPISINGPAKMPNGNLGAGHDSKPYQIVAGTDSLSSIRSKASAEPTPSVSDPVVIPSGDSRIPTSIKTIQPEVRIEQMATETSTHILVDSGVGKTESTINSHSGLENGDGSQESSSVVKKEASEPANVALTNASRDSPTAEKSHVPSSTAVKPTLRDVGPLAGVEEAASKLVKLNIFDGQNVIIPDHIQVPDAVKSVLSFGTINASFGVGGNYVKNENIKNIHSAREAAPEEVIDNSSLCDKDAPATQAEHTDNQQLQSHFPDENSPMDTQVSSSNNDEQLKENSLPVEGPPFPIVQTTPSYSFGFMPPMPANTHVQPDGFGSEAHVSSSQSGSSSAVPSVSLTPPITQSNGVGQASIAMSQQQLPLFRQHYPPNYMPYGHYFSPFYVPPTMHQYYGHTAFPPTLPTNNVFPPPPTAAAATKTSPAHYKPGTNAGNQTPAGVPSGYGVYSSSQAGYSPNISVTGGNPGTSADLMPTTSIDNYVYSGQQSEGSTVWLPAPGRDTANYPPNSFFNLPPQGHHLINPHSGHVPFAVYHTLQPMPTPTPGHPLLQHSQPATGHVEPVGPPSHPYQQSQRQHPNQHPHQHQHQHQHQPQMNWNM